MDLRTAISTAAPIVATTILGLVAFASHRAPPPHDASPEPAFAGTCDRHDYARIADHLEVDAHFTCQPGRFAEPGVFAMNGREAHVFGVGMRDLAAPHPITLPGHDSVAARVVDVDGDGVDEIILWSVDAANLASCSLPAPAPVTCKPVHMRVVAVRDGKLALSDWHRYNTRISPLGAARWIVTHDHFGAAR